MGASDVVVGKGELFFSEVIPLGFTKLYLVCLICFFMSFNCVCMGLPGLTSIKDGLMCLIK